VDALARSLDETELERLTHAFGAELFARVDRRGPLLLSPSWWDERVMALTMDDEALKVQLFRFIDALPLLKTPEAVVRHLREYLEQAGPHLPAWTMLGMRLMPKKGIFARFLAWQARRSARRLARRFIAGGTLDEALDTVLRLRRRKLGFTVDLLGEATITESEAGHNQQDYLHLVKGLGEQARLWREMPQIDRDPYGPLPRVNVSIKLSALYSQFDPIDPEGTSEAVRRRLRPILLSARENGVFINLDMEQSSFKDVTLRIFREILEEPDFRDWSDVGIAIQAYLRSCERDLHELAEWTKRRGAPIWIRLIKGAYWDYETVICAQEGWPVPVFAHKWETDANYEKLSLFLLRNHRLLRPAFGSHNIRSLSHAMAAAKMLDLPPRSFEIQMLYGMGDPIQDSLVRLDQRVRVYTPYGQLLPGMAYLVRRLLENTANTSFLRASFTENVAEEKLLANPLTHRKPHLDPSTHHDAMATQHTETITSPFRNEPLTDFSIEENRQKMLDALVEVRRKVGQKHPLVIAGRRIDTKEWIASTNPSHLREVVGECGRATKDHALQAIAAAREAFPAWRDTPTEGRCSLLEEVAEKMRRRRFELAAWQVLECAKQWREADADVAEAIDFCVYYAQQARHLDRPTGFHLPGEENTFLYEPRGVAVVIAPWNFPLAILCGMSAAALAVGNTVIMKPAEQSSIIAAKLQDILEEAGFPKGVVNYLPGVGEEIGPTLVDDPRVDLIAFTGSRGVGLALNKQASVVHQGQDHIKRIIVELGGKNAVIVDDDADLDEAVAGVVASAFGYQGQKCSACSRAIVLESIHDQFLSRLVEATRSLKIGPAEDPGSRVGPVIDAEARERILAAIEKGKSESRLVYAGDLGFLVNEGHYVAPHVFADVSPNTAIAQEEIFGPVLAVIKVKDLDEALAVANGTQYALTGGLFTRSPEHIRRVRREFRVGNLYINRKITGALVARQPFGGFKLSGGGTKAGGQDYLLQFVVPRTITENTMRRGFAPPPEES